MVYPKTHNPCDDCPYNFSKNNQESNTCKICEFKELLDKQKDLEAEYSRLLSSSLEQFQKGYNRGYDDAYKVAKTEAYKEFADTLEKSILSQLGISAMEKSEAYYYCLDCIKNILQELTERKEDKNGSL